MKTLSERGDATGLPRPLTSFVGRERELAELGALFRRGRPLVTLTGAGGVGKTRLALEVARQLVVQRVFPDGVFFVALESLAEATLLPHAVASVLGVRERTRWALLETLVEALRARRRLVVLDNCEHIVGAAAALADEILKGCAGVRILATSREPLAVAGETIVRVPPLAAPPDEYLSAPQLSAYPAARLFLERAALHGAVTADVSEVRARAVARICRRLDGLPLAIELAASRLSALGDEELAARLDERFRLLTSGSRTAPARQQTLRATVEWSYQLLSAPERTLFGRLGVFAGGFTLGAAEAVCGEGLDAVILLAQLADKSLVVAEPAEDGTIRYRVLETLRAYARERLEATGEAQALSARHADYYLAREEGPPEALRVRLARASAGAEPAGRARLARELDNLRAALRWCLEHGAVERGLAAAVGPLAGLWASHGHYAEGYRWADAFLAAGEDLPAWLRAGGHAAAGLYAGHLGDHAEARVRFETSIALSREAGEAPMAALSMLGITRWLDDDDEGATAVMQESLAAAEAAGDGLAIAQALRDLSLVAGTQGDYPTARALLERSVRAARGPTPRLQHLSSLARLGRIAFLEGQPRQAATHLRETLAGLTQAGAVNLVPNCLEWLAPIVGASGYPREAARLLGAADAGRRVMQRVRYHREDPTYQRDVSAIRAQLAADEFDTAWGEGKQMGLAQAASYALEISAGTGASGVSSAGAAEGRSRPSSPRVVSRLTPRESEVAALVADGLTNRRIAERLVLSERTVENHLQRIMGKLGARNRAQVAAHITQRSKTAA